MEWRNRRAGFTLIEISIVLIVIGLITGGILVGRELVKHAQVRAMVTQLEKFNTAVNTFKGKYGCVPGLCPNGSTFGFPGPATNNATNSLWGGPNGGTYLVAFWNQLFFAGLIAERWPNYTTSGSAYYYPGSTSPTCPLCTGYAACTQYGATCRYSGGWTPWQLSTNATSSLDCPIIPSIAFSTYRGSVPTAAFVWDISVAGGPTGGLGGAITPSDALLLDRKIDDGKPLTGGIIGINTYTYGNCSLDGNSSHALGLMISGNKCINTATNAYVTTTSNNCGGFGTLTNWGIDLLMPASFE